MTDEQLVLASQRHDRDAFGWLVKRHQSAAYAHVYKLAPEWQDSSDLVQEAFLRLLGSIQTLRHPQAFRSWLKRIVTNLFYDQLRRRPNHSTLSIDASLEDEDGEDSGPRQIPDPSALPDQLAEWSELSETIECAVAKLPHLARSIIILREVDDLSYIEIAESTKCPIGTVKSRVKRARTRLQILLLPYIEDHTRN
jgi:RNA polymerase sigma-70 factor (ECF subfamily)